nr:family 20 glycosylhydrolase [Tessaracoccus coleopterorum]
MTAADRAGLRYGIFTIGQLAERTAGGTVLPAVVIEDRPRFRYRGLMVDTVRHFFDVDTIKAVIDRAVRLKLNALHLHLTDDQGWRIETPSRPELTERASGTAAFGGGAASTPWPTTPGSSPTRPPTTWWWFRRSTCPGTPTPSPWPTPTWSRPRSSSTASPRPSRPSAAGTRHG